MLQIQETSEIKTRCTKKELQQEPSKTRYIII